MNTVFVSYSHRDEKYKDMLRPHLGMLEQAGRITVWDDRKIGAGDKWYDEIFEAMDSAAVAVCLISADYLSSKFCMEDETPHLLKRRKKDGMVILPVLVRPCLWETVEWLKKTQMLPRDGKSVLEHFKGSEDIVFRDVGKRVLQIVDGLGYVPPAPPPPKWSPPERIDITRLPVTGAELFGRTKELALLDDAWESKDTNVISFVAWGGIGKSTLVNRWLERLEADNYRGARRVYGWSFYSQGTGERVTSADLFIAEALRWFGDKDPAAGSPWDKGQRLAELVRKERTLLVLDGMEPLQSYLDYQRGKINDPALAVLVEELCLDNPGLCVITTREEIPELEKEFADKTQQHNLDQISPEAGRALLRVGRVHGTDQDLERASQEFGNHALAINLLTAYLHDIPGRSVSEAFDIPDLDVPEEKGKHPRRVIAAFEERFGEGPEVEVLHILGLFDRPANADEIAAVRRPPAIPHLTDYLQDLDGGRWEEVLSTLRRIGLIAKESEHRPGTLDTHPVVREHFGENLQVSYPDSWKQGHRRLYEYYKALPEKDLPDTLEEMAPLFLAVIHGCNAGEYDDARNDVYNRRIKRGNEAFAVKQLGAYGALLAALAGFFEKRWTQPVDDLRHDHHPFVIADAGFFFRALGRLGEAVGPLEVAQSKAIHKHDWESAATIASLLSELHLSLGNVTEAMRYARASVKLADRSGGAFQRMVRRTTLADALHQAGRFDEAEAMFREAEAMQKERQPQYTFLYSLQGYQYCDLLLARGQWAQVLDRATRTLAWVTEEGWLLDIGLDHVSLGRAQILDVQQEGAGDLSAAAEQLDCAVQHLRRAGQHVYIAIGVLARTELYRVTEDYPGAKRDVDEAMRIAKRGGMRLHECDCHLEYARLALAQEDCDEARTRVATARKMVQDMGYHRRDKDLEDIERQLEDKP